MKKNLKVLALFLLMGVAATAQTLLVNHTDAATGNRMIKTDNQEGAKLDMDDSIAKDGALFFSVGYQSATVSGKLVETYFIDFNIIHNDYRLGCLQELDSHAILTLEDGTKMECFQISESDCDKAAYHADFALMPKSGSPDTMKKNFDKLMTTGISEILIITTEGKLDYKIKKNSREYIKKHFALIDKTVGSGS